MKAFADKILFVAGIGTLLASAGWTFVSIGNVNSKKVKMVNDLPPSAEAELAEPPAFDSDIPVWEKSTTQDPLDENWIYSVFTPPKIYVATDGTFSAKPPTPPKELPPPPKIGVKLVDIQQEPYRFQFVGYIEDVPGDPTKTLAMLSDRKTNFRVRARMGREFPEEGIRIKEIIIKRERDEAGKYVRTERVVVEEIATGREVALDNGVIKFDEDLLIRIQSTETSDIVEVTQLDSSFELNNVVYQLRGIDVSEKSIVVSKLIETDEGPDTLTKKLSISDTTEASSTTEGSAISLF